jgi:hypothetical protein
VIRIYAALALVLLAITGGWYYGHTRYEAGIAAQRAVTEAQAAKFAEQAKAAEQAQAAQLSTIAQQYEQDKADAQAKADRTIADLRAGTVRLRKQWTCPAQVPGAAAGSAEPDADAQLREQGAGDLVRLAAEADAQIRGLQAAVKAQGH